MRGNEYGAALLPLEGIYHFPTLFAQAEADLHQKRHHAGNEKGQAMRHAVGLVVAGKRTVPVLLMNIESHYRFILARASAQIEPITSSICILEESTGTASSAGRRGAVSRLESSWSRRMMSESTSS